MPTKTFCTIVIITQLSKNTYNNHIKGKARLSILFHWWRWSCRCWFQRWRRKARWGHRKWGEKWGRVSRMVMVMRHERGRAVEKRGRGQSRPRGTTRGWGRGWQDNRKQSLSVSQLEPGGHLLLPFRPPVLKPGLDLDLGQVQHLW